MGTINQIDIKNRNYYFYNDMIDIKTNENENDMKIKSYLKNTMMFSMELEIKSKK